ncbi:MAG: DNA gyrase inhibitor YacG [Gammaproteobacteria bacterium]
MKKILCPTCNKTTSSDRNNPCKPFCSEKCKMIDLGSWLSERYSIPDQQLDPNNFEGEQGQYREH